MQNKHTVRRKKGVPLTGAVSSADWGWKEQAPRLRSFFLLSYEQKKGGKSRRT